MRFVILFLFLVIIGGLVGIVVAPSYIDWNQQKPLIEKQLTKALGVPGVKLVGDFSFKVLPAPSLHADAVHIAPYNGDVNIAEISNLDAKFSWQSIAAFKLHAKSITADEVTVNLIKQDANTANYLAERRSRRVSVPRSLYPLSGVDALVVGKLAFHHEDKAAQTKQELLVQDLKVFAPALSQTKLEVSGTYNETPISLNGTMNLDSLRQVVTDLTLKLAENSVQFKGNVFDPFHQPMFKGKLTIGLTSFDDVFTKLGTLMPTGLMRFKNIQSLAFNGDVMLSEGTSTIENAELTLPTYGTIEGRLSSKDKGPNGRPFHDVALTSKEFDLGNFLQAVKTTDTATPPSKTAWPDAPFDLSFLEGNDFKVALKVDALKLQNRTFDAFDIKLNNENKTLMLEDGLIGMAQGSVRLNGQMQYTSLPHSQLTMRFAKMPLAAFFATAEAPISGGVTGNVELQAKGNDLQAMMSSLAGKGDLKVTEGSLNKIDLKDTVTAMRQIFKKQSSKFDTPFTDMGLTFEIEKGTLRNDDFYLKTEDVGIKAEGKIDIGNKTINYSVNPQTKAGITDLIIPVKVVGPLDAPNIVPVVTGSVGKATAIGAMLGGPVGAAVGAMVGSQLSKDNKAPELSAQEKATIKEATEQPTAPAVEEPAEPALPFDLQSASPEDVRKYFDAQNQ